MGEIVDLTEPSAGRRWWPWLAAWTGATLVYAGVVHGQIGVPFLYALQQSAFYYYSLALLMIPVGRLSARLMGPPRPVAQLVVAHALMGVATLTVWQGLTLAYYRWAVGPHFWQLIFQQNWMFQLSFAVTVYGTALSITLTVQAWARERERERREAALVVAARDAELEAIKTQFQPHFVLNALNSLLALIDRDPALARTMVVRLADLMKSVFDRVDVPEVPLERELDLVRAYLDVERIRLGTRLAVGFEIDDAARGVMVPPFLLQPLVENAVKHGVAPFSRPGLVRVSAQVVGGRVRVTVRDSGSAAVPAAHGVSTGRGLQLTRRRLDTVYGTSYQLTFDRGEDGTAVHLELPLESAHVA